MRRRPPRATLTDTLLPYTTLFRPIPGSTSAEWVEEAHPRQHAPVSIRGLTPGIAYNLGDCCHPVPGDRIVGVRRTGEPIEVHTIDCRSLEVDQNDDWVDLSWDSKSKGGTARLQVGLEERRVGQEWVRSCRSRWSPYH